MGKVNEVQVVHLDDLSNVLLVGEENCCDNSVVFWKNSKEKRTHLQSVLQNTSAPGQQAEHIGILLIYKMLRLQFSGLS